MQDLSTALSTRMLLEAGSGRAKLPDNNRVRERERRGLTCGQVGGAHVRRAPAEPGGEHRLLQGEFKDF